MKINRRFASCLLALLFGGIALSDMASAEDTRHSSGQTTFANQSGSIQCYSVRSMTGENRDFCLAAGEQRTMDVQTSDSFLCHRKNSDPSGCKDYFITIGVEAHCSCK